MSAKKTTLRILSSLKSIIDDDFSCPICSEAYINTLVNPHCGHRFCGKCIKEDGKGNRDCPTCGVQIAAHHSCRADSHFDHILKKVVTELVVPLEMLLASKENRNDSRRPQKDQARSTKGEVSAQHKKLEEVCAQNQAIAAFGSRKRHHSSQEQQFLYTKATNEEAMYDGGKNDALVERRRKALKTNKGTCTTTVPCLPELRLQHKSPNQIVTRTDYSPRDFFPSQVKSSHTIVRQMPKASCKNTGIETAILTANQNNPLRYNLSKEVTRILQEQEQEQEQSPSKTSNQSVAAGNNNNDPSRADFDAKQKSPASCFESSETSLVKDPKLIELLKHTPCAFKKRTEELMAFKAKHGHYNVTQSKCAANRPYISLGRWCNQVRQSRRFMEEGIACKLKLSQVQIDCLDSFGFEWKLPKHSSASSFEERFEELKAFKAKYGHFNVTQSTSDKNKPHVVLGRWCSQIRQSRKLMESGMPPLLKVSKAQIESLDGLGFPWALKRSTFDKRFTELEAYKAKFGDCNATQSAAPSNKPYVPLGRWCCQVRQTRKYFETGIPCQQKLTKAQIEKLENIGFPWELKTAFDKRFEELQAFKEKFGHCNVTKSRSPSNEPYQSLGYWCGQVRRSCRKWLAPPNNKPAELKELSKEQVDRLNALGFRWH